MGLYSPAAQAAGCSMGLHSPAAQAAGYSMDLYFPTEQTAGCSMNPHFPAARAAGYSTNLYSPAARADDDSMSLHFPAGLHPPPYRFPRQALEQTPLPWKEPAPMTAARMGMFPPIPASNRCSRQRQKKHRGTERGPCPFSGAPEDWDLSMVYPSLRVIPFRR